jgi:hypothetical protein
MKEEDLPISVEKRQPASHPCRFRKFHPAQIRVVRQNHHIIGSMFVILHALGMFVAGMFKSRRRLEAENLFLRHQLKIALKRAPPRLRLHRSDRALLVRITRIWPIVNCAISSDG